jgi:hypothetical protein
VFRVTREGEDVGTMTQEIETVTLQDGVVTATIANTHSVRDSAGEVRTSEGIATYRKDAEGVSYVEGDAERVTEFKLPLEDGTTWVDRGIAIAVEAIETIDVPYRSGLTAVRVGGETRLGLVRNWYVAGVGFTKSEFPNSAQRTMRFELTDYTTVPSNPVY